MAATKKARVAPTEANVSVVSQTSAIKQLVWLADAFHRIGLFGPFETQMPLFCSAEVRDKGFRKFNLPLDTLLETDSMRIGARDGLIFRFKPKVAIERKSTSGGKDFIEFVEMGWNDVCNVFSDLGDQIEKRILDVRGVPLLINDLDKEIKSAIQKNKNMHAIVVQGFTRAQELARSQSSDSVLEHIEGYGSF